MSSRRIDPVSIAATLVLVALLPLWIRHLVPSPEPHDFFVDWMAARDLLAGRPLYRPLADELPAIGVPGRFLVRYTTHPPTAALVALPVARLDYPAAFLVWNLASLALLGHALWLIARELEWAPAPRTLVLGCAALLGWVPLWDHVEHGQSGLVLLWLCVLAWRGLRRGRDACAGIAIGTAAAIKLYPGLLLLYLVLGRRWRAFAAALGTVCVVVALTVVGAGADAWRRYLELGAPELQRWWPHWGNASIVGFVTRLLLPDETCVPLVTNGPLAVALILAAMGAALFTVARCCLADPTDVDRGVALTLTAAVLLSAVAWQHYFVVLLLPLAVTLRRLRRLGRWPLGALVVAWILMDVPQLRLATAVLGDAPASALASLTYVSVEFYGLAAFFVWQALAWRRERRFRP